LLISLFCLLRYFDWRWLLFIFADAAAIIVILMAPLAKADAACCACYLCRHDAITLRCQVIMIAFDMMMMLYACINHHIISLPRATPMPMKTITYYDETRPAPRRHTSLICALCRRAYAR